MRLEIRDRPSKYSNALHGISVCLVIFESYEVSEEDRREICECLETGKISEVEKLLKPGTSGVLESLKQAFNALTRRKSQETAGNTKNKSKDLHKKLLSADFFDTREKLLEKWPELQPHIDNVMEAATEHFASNIERTLRKLSSRVCFECERQLKEQAKLQMSKNDEERKEASLLQLFQLFDTLYQSNKAKVHS